MDTKDKDLLEEIERKKVTIAQLRKAIEEIKQENSILRREVERRLAQQDKSAPGYTLPIADDGSRVRQEVSPIQQPTSSNKTSENIPESQLMVEAVTLQTSSQDIKNVLQDLSHHTFKEDDDSRVSQQPASSIEALSEYTLQEDSTEEDETCERYYSAADMFYYTAEESLIAANTELRNRAIEEANLGSRSYDADISALTDDSVANPTEDKIRSQRHTHQPQGLNSSSSTEVSAQSSRTVPYEEQGVHSFHPDIPASTDDTRQICIVDNTISRKSFRDHPQGPDSHGSTEVSAQFSRIVPYEAQGAHSIHPAIPALTDDTRQICIVDSAISKKSFRDHPQGPDSHGSTEVNAQSSTIVPYQAQDISLPFWASVIGEICAHLNRKIMTFILGRMPQKNECSVSDILNVIEQATTNPMTRHVNEFLRAVMSNRYTTIMTVLNRLGYNAYVHPHNTEELIQRCGLLNHRPQRGTPEYYALNNYDYLHTIIMKDVPETIRETCLILLNCLHYLAREEGQPMFMW